jgi:hypothetical protein
LPTSCTPTAADAGDWKTQRAAGEPGGLFLWEILRRNIEILYTAKRLFLFSRTVIQATLFRITKNHRRAC